MWVHLCPVCHPFRPPLRPGPQLHARKLIFLQPLCRCLYTGLASQLHGCSALSQRLGTTPMASSDSLEAEPHQYAKGCRHASTTARATVSENLIRLRKRPVQRQLHSSQQRLRNGYCLKYAQNRWRYELLHKITALNVFIVMQGGFEHELHAFVVAWAPTAHTPISRSLAEQNTNFLMARHAEKLRKN